MVNHIYIYIYASQELPTQSVDNPQLDFERGIGDTPLTDGTFRLWNQTSAGYGGGADLILWSHVVTITWPLSLAEAGPLFASGTFDDLFVGVSGCCCDLAKR